LLRRFGVSPSLVGAGSLLSSLLGGGRQVGTDVTSSGAPAIHLPVTLKAGLVSIGPVKTPLAVPSLY
jgi:hypothetical protein